EGRARQISRSQVGRCMALHGTRSARGRVIIRAPTGGLEKRMRQSLTGGWHFRFDRDADWRPIDVPGCWEMAGVPKYDPGPASYRREVRIPADWAGQRIWLCFGAVSYACRVEVNGQL